MYRSLFPNPMGMRGCTEDESKVDMEEVPAFREQEVVEVPVADAEQKAVIDQHTTAVTQPGRESVACSAAALVLTVVDCVGTVTPEPASTVSHSAPAAVGLPVRTVV